MTGEVLEFDGITRLDVPAGRVLERAVEHDLDVCVVVGFDKDGEFYFASSSPDGGNAIWLLESAKHKLMQIAYDE